MWDGISEDGAAGRTVTELKKGDKIEPVYYSIDEDGNDKDDYIGEEYTLKGDLQIDYDLLYPGDYLYAFCIDDIYGDYLVTDFAEFNLDKKGNVSFYTE